MCLLRHILICSAIFNLLTFLIGLFLGIFREDFLLVSLILTAVGLLGMILFAVTWFNRPKVIHRPIYLVKRWKQEKQTRDTAITPDTTEAVMKNIRGIPFLIQAIQYSMETTYYRDVMSEMGEGVVRTSVIHTAPACTSILDSESDDETQDRRVTSRQQECRSSAEEQWLPFGESWRNEQLRLSLERGSSNLLVFPYCEASPQRDSIGAETIEHDFSRIESIKRPHGRHSRGHFGRGRSPLSRNHFQVRCIGMSASFIEKFNSSFRTSSFD